MPIPAELKAMIAEARRLYPQLASLPDEAVARMILQSMQERQSGVRNKSDLPQHVGSPAHYVKWLRK